MSHDEDGFNGASASWIARSDVLGDWDKAPIGVPIVPQVSVERSAGIPQETSLTELVRLMMAKGCPPEMILMATALYEKNSQGIPRNSAEKTQAEKDFERAEDRRRKDRERKELAKSKTENLHGIPRNGVNGDYISSSLPLEEYKEKKEETGNTRARGRTLPDDWQPNSKHFDEGQKLGCSRESVLAQAEDMRIWAQANRNRAVARKADWNLTFLGWMRRNRKPSNGRQDKSAVDAANRIMDHFGGVAAASAYVPGSQGPKIGLVDGNGQANPKRIPKG